MFCEVNTDHVSRRILVSISCSAQNEKFALSCLQILRCEKRPHSGGKFDEYFDRLLSDSESEEINFKTACIWQKQLYLMEPAPTKRPSLRDY